MTICDDYIDPKKKTKIQTKSWETGYRTHIETDYINNNEYVQKYKEYSQIKLNHIILTKCLIDIIYMCFSMVDFKMDLYINTLEQNIKLLNNIHITSHEKYDKYYENFSSYRQHRVYENLEKGVQQKVGGMSNINHLQSGGDYKQKYLKYKQKYLELKNS